MDNYLQKSFEEEISAIIDEEGNVIVETLILSPLQILKSDDDAYTESFLSWKSTRRDDLLKKAQNILEKNDRRIFLRIEDCFNNENIVPFIGAGMSKSSGLLLWSELLDSMCDQTGGVDGVLSNLMRSESYDEVVQYLVSIKGEMWLRNEILHQYQSYRSEEIKGAINYLPNLFTTGILTTNYDNLLERCYEEQDEKKVPLSVHSRFSPEDIIGLLDSGQKFLFKLHGSYDDTSARVLTSAEYDTAYNDTSFLAILQHIFLRKNVLFLGCSLASDRTMKILLDLVDKQPDLGPHYAFLSRPSKEWMKKEKESFLTQRGIMPIWYDGDHDECLAALFERLLSTKESRSAM